MKIYKLSAISSTNDYLRELVFTKNAPNYTVVTTDYQTSGKGQFKNKWHSEKGKNLLFSILVEFKGLKINDQAYLNFAISLAVYDVLITYLPTVKIKWPNDILSRHKKIAGILIENSVKNGRLQHSIIGIGLNVNQINFPLNLPNATSLKKELVHSFNRDKLLEKIVLSVQKKIALLKNESFSILKKTYLKHLYKINKPTMFQDLEQNRFMGKIIDVSNEGLLKVELENETIREFAVKEIAFILTT